MELVDDDVGIFSQTQNKKILNLSRPNSLKKQHVHWPDRPATLQTDTFFADNILNTNTLTESPSSRRHRSFLVTLSSAPSYSTSTPIIPAGSLVHNTGTSQSLTSVRNSTPISMDLNLIL